jgi:type IV fimbrial biogenesis protein FimT
MKKQTGFSIIEIAVVLVVVGMMLMSAMPMMSDWMRNAKLRNQAEALQSGLQQARNEAVRRNQAITFYMVSGDNANALDDTCVVSSSGTSWVVSVRNPAGECDAAPAVTSTDGSNPLIVRTHVGADGASGVSVNGLASDGTTAASSVTFDAFGRASGSLVRINVAYATSQDADRPLRVDISPAGMVRMCDTQITDSTDPRRCPSSASDASAPAGGTGTDTPISTPQTESQDVQTPPSN